MTEKKITRRKDPESIEDLLARPRIYLRDAPRVSGLSRTSLYRRIVDKKIVPPQEDGGLKYWPTPVFIDWLNAQDNQPTSA